MRYRPFVAGPTIRKALRRRVLQSLQRPGAEVKVELVFKTGFNASVVGSSNAQTDEKGRPIASLQTLGRRSPEGG